jgi:hypothetical protein
LSRYEATDFEGAVNAFERVLAGLPTDTVAQVLIKRARRLAGEVAASAEPAAIVARLDKV